MLVLSRQRDETIMIGDDIEITVVDLRGDKVRLGIRAPRDVSVHRKEVYDAIKRENRAASQLQPHDLIGDAPPAPALRLASDPPHHTSAQDESCLLAALDEAEQGLAEGGLPIGSVLVRDGQIIGRGHNQRVQKNDPMAHAEIECLKNAGRQKTYRDCVLYSTLMPCYLCAGAVVQFAIPRLVAGESVNFKGASEFLHQHGVEVADRHDDRCISLMRNFIQAHPDLWHEDVGR